VRITTKGQVTIPGEIREKFGFLPATEVDFVIEGKKVYLKRGKDSGRRGAGLIRHMQGKSTIKMTTDQILALTRGD